ncbi:hypothetical protein GCM10007079_47950 [Nocardiopsis terrae]|uniref:Uncharacterized protein n=1 Tax=Nocardiopsis terrae TaxID=372655 RepID=A0ABR9HAM9_9ACTN|nr:hypothetical protein [Nocardiopsis terrae]MBE1456089.1 hypothetical protein [Nocardiopsis terrae]GHC95938.1 hypothetical protein GCM10007079_47950 [Nocardiopsis terrae]
MPSPATPAPYRPRLLRVIGAAFVGSTLIAVMAPAHADPVAASLAFDRPAEEVGAGTELAPNPLTVTNNSGELALCLIGLDVPASDFHNKGFPAGAEVAPGASLPLGTVDGPARQTVDVVATLAYAFADAETGCVGAEADEYAAATWSVQVTDPTPSPSPTPTPPPTEKPTKTPSPSPTDLPTKTPSPSPSPTEKPTRTPSPSPTDLPTKTPSPSPTPSPTSPTESESGTPSPKPSPTAGTTDKDSNGSSGDGGSGNRNSGAGNSGNDRTPSNNSGRPPRSNVSSVPTSSASIPTLPSDEAELPDLAPGPAEDLAELPLVTPTSGEDEDTETEIAADHADLGPSVTPAVLLAAFLLALLLATPLAPTRRVRLGGGYQGRRRKG